MTIHMLTITATMAVTITGTPPATASSVSPAHGSVAKTAADTSVSNTFLNRKAAGLAAFFCVSRYCLEFREVQPMQDEGSRSWCSRVHDRLQHQDSCRGGVQ